MNQWTRSLLGICLLLGLWLGMTAVGIASVHEYPEGAGTVMVRSLQTLRDRRDQAWQLVLYKRGDGRQAEQLHLRLVGFPGDAIFPHPAPISITVGDRTWQLSDVLPTDGRFPANVGEYDVLELMSHLTSNAPLQLVVPLEQRSAELVIPPFVVKEWRHLVSINQSGG